MLSLIDVGSLKKVVGALQKSLYPVIIENGPGIVGLVGVGVGVGVLVGVGVGKGLLQSYASNETNDVNGPTATLTGVGVGVLVGV